MHLIKSFFFVVSLLSISGFWATASSTKANSGVSSYGASNGVNLNIHAAPAWKKLALTVDLPIPFNQTTVILWRKDKNNEMVTYKVDVVTNKGRTVASRTLTNVLKFPSLPAVGYDHSNIDDGKLSKFSFDIRYGLPIGKETKLCHPPSCVYYRIAQFVVTSNFHVIREKDLVLPYWE